LFKPRNIKLSQPECRAIAFQQCPAKTYIGPSGSKEIGRDVFQHCQIVGSVAAELVARMSSAISTQLFPEGSSLVAACHDIGKVSPTFAKKILSNTSGWKPEHTPELKGINADLEKGWGGHAGVSQVAAKALGIGEYIPEILGQHHGFAPSVDMYSADAEAFGGHPWQQERELLVDALKEALDCDWPIINNFEQARAIAGLTSVSDWIGSGSFFENPKQDWMPNIKQAVDDAGFTPPNVRPELSFSDVFPFKPHLAQAQFISQVTKPGVYILEAPMGMGKTEAALYAAYKLMAQEQASGIYFALPTQLTSNKIYARFNVFLKTILEEDCRHRRSLLLHGSAWLLEETEMGEDGRPGGAWFNSSKRGLLAPFAVGTIDQALMAVMNVKHGFVRAFGLAGKVVILDEVHTYDAYTGTILDALVKGLRQLQCTVIILTATLNQDRRQSLLGCPVVKQDYPLISALANNGPLQEHAVKVTSRLQLTIRLESDDNIALEEALNRAEQGQQVLWIENTVKEAQQRYFDLAARCYELGIDCGLLHSRFTAAHRQKNEDKWVSLFGKEGWPQRAEQGRILVGTQVLEQSLDIDADFLISRFAPTDMLLQRIGRLWRHTETPRHPHADCCAYILAPELEKSITQPQQAFGSTAWVYSPYVLCRSLEIWQQRQRLCLPDDIRPLIEATYQKRPETEPMSRWLHELEQGTRQRTGQRALKQSARITLATSGKTLPESKAQTRYSETDNADVLLLRSIDLVPDEKASHLLLLDGSTLILPWHRSRLDKPHWRKLAANLMSQVVHVRFAEAPEPLLRSMLIKAGFQHCFYLGNPEQDEALLRVAVVDKSSKLRGYQGAPINAQFYLSYRDDVGYHAEKIKE